MSSRGAAAVSFGGAAWATTEGSGGGGGGGGGDDGRRLPAKVLVKVAIERSLAAVHLVVAPETTGAELIRKAVDAYSKEGARPLLTTPDPKAYDLHYSQYSLQSLDPAEKVINLGSRNFFLCLHRPA